MASERVKRPTQKQEPMVLPLSHDERDSLTLRIKSDGTQSAKTEDNVEADICNYLVILMHTSRPSKVIQSVEVAALVIMNQRAADEGGG